MNGFVCSRCVLGNVVPSEHAGPHLGTKEEPRVVSASQDATSAALVGPVACWERQSASRAASTQDDGNSRCTFRSGPRGAGDFVLHDDRLNTPREPVGMRDRLSDRLRTQTEALQFLAGLRFRRVSGCSRTGLFVPLLPIPKAEVGSGARRTRV